MRGLFAVVLLGALVHADAAFAQADPNKVLRVAFPVAETGFDPQAAGDAYSNYVNRAIFDSLYRYDHLARPFKLVPSTAVALPAMSADGKTWTIRLKPGIYFNDDPAFKGQRRELVAEDYVYSFKRILDPRLRSNSLTQVDGRFVGADAVVAKARETGKFDYDAPMEGLRALDRHTLQFKLNFADTELLANLTVTSMGAVAREVIEAYGDASGWAMANPVGTGPYRLKEWRRGQKIVLEPNPGFREMKYPVSNDPADRALMKHFAGRKLPLIGRIEISIIEESNPRMLAFEQGQLDYLALPVDLTRNVLDGDNKLKPKYTAQSVVLGRGIQPAVSYTFFNMEDPIVGGYSTERIALRRAIAMSYNVEDEIKVIRQGQAVPATQVIPPMVTGHDPKFNGAVKYDPAGARALLDKFGYVDRDKDGFRDLPDGSPFTLKMGSAIGSLQRETDELWQRSFSAVGIRVEFIKQKWPDLLKAARLGQLQVWFLGNINATPEGFGFLGLLYGGHAGFSNLSRFKLPEYDRLYVEARAMPDGPQREKLMRRMSELVSVYAPWMLQAFRIENVLVRPWIVGYRYNPFALHPWQYYDLDATVSRKIPQ